ncbi:TonB-dependent receptor [Sphingomonas rhizophila]|uniref:TonB-dependent receptor n=1 Tax=Sphingomonas rhizophila TaxID=2071607 RepID=A0A7G9SCR6_9SPHN|nr:TonB-dependent receptor [Sphingomonas rhizophila]QNN65641.1 TonB-dependent receptor [Sphingomonas rhizophila]
MKKVILLCSAAFVAPTAAFAQSTGSVDFEKETVVVTGTRTQDVGGIQSPDTSKAKAVVTQELISRNGPGQTVLDTINVVPGVSFQNNDAYGNAGGTLTVRGFDSTRVSYTLDGIQLNDSGNYSIYSNFSIDPELIEQVNVNLGSTDVDSPTASAVGGTINQRTRNPAKVMGGRFSASVGQYDYRRYFGLFDTGEFTPWGTRAFVSASTSKYDNPFNNYGKLDRQQYNAKVYQPIGSAGDFVSVAGRYNQDRNNFFGSLALDQNFPTTKDEREYVISGYPCTTDEPQAGVADTNNSCGTQFDRRYNPSNSVNIRANSRFTLAPGLVLTVDPSYQYTKANGGGTTSSSRPAREYGYDINPAGGRSNCSTTVESATVVCIPGYFGGAPYFDGVDLNGDGDTLDSVTVLAPSQTRTRRYAVIAGLRYDINDNHTVRATFTHDYSNHRQTGQVGLIDRDGEPLDVFPVNNPLEGANGVALQKRDRQSYAILNQVAGEYRGEFGPLTVNAGARLPFFKRDLENNCFASSADGNVECSGGDIAIDALVQQYNPYVISPTTGLPTGGYALPGKRVLKYSKFLPNVGVVYDFTPRISAFANYAKGLSVPSTDNLYNAFYFPLSTNNAKPRPEMTDSFDGGVRYRSSKIQAQLATWYTKFTDRLASAYDPELDRSVYRNLGRVNKWGIDGSVAYQPNKILTLYAFGSWNKSKIQDNIQIGGGADFDCDEATADATGLRNCAFTAGNRESGSPTYTYGGSGVVSLGPVDLGVTAKKTGKRYIYDTNMAVYSGDVDGLSTTVTTDDPVQIFSAAAPAYWLVNLDARLNMGHFDKQLDKTYLQLNVYNLFDETYVGGFGGGLNQGVSSSGVYGFAPNVQIGAPRTVSLTVNVGF